MLVISCDIVCLYIVQCYYCSYPSQACARHSTFATYSFPLKAVKIGGGVQKKLSQNAAVLAR